MVGVIDKERNKHFNHLDECLYYNNASFKSIIESKIFEGGGDMTVNYYGNKVDSAIRRSLESHFLKELEALKKRKVEILHF